MEAAKRGRVEENTGNAPCRCASLVVPPGELGAWQATQRAVHHPWDTPGCGSSSERTARRCREWPQEKRAGRESFAPTSGVRAVAKPHTDGRTDGHRAGGGRGCSAFPPSAKHGVNFPEQRLHPRGSRGGGGMRGRLGRALPPGSPAALPAPGSWGRLRRRRSQRCHKNRRFLHTLPLRL